MKQRLQQVIRDLWGHLTDGSSNQEEEMFGSRKESEEDEFYLKTPANWSFSSFLLKVNISQTSFMTLNSI